MKRTACTMSVIVIRFGIKIYRQILVNLASIKYREYPFSCSLIFACGHRDERMEWQTDTHGKCNRRIYASFRWECSKTFVQEGDNEILLLVQNTPFYLFGIYINSQRSSFRQEIRPPRLMEFQSHAGSAASYESKNSVCHIPRGTGYAEVSQALLHFNPTNKTLSHNYSFIFCNDPSFCSVNNKRTLKIISMDHGSSWEADSRLSGQIIPEFTERE
jgi:hypothetical protein